MSAVSSSSSHLRTVGATAAMQEEEKGVAHLLLSLLPAILSWSPYSSLLSIFRLHFCTLVIIILEKNGCETCGVEFDYQVTLSGSCFICAPDATTRVCTCALLLLLFCLLLRAREDSFLVPTAQIIIISHSPPPHSSNTARHTQAHPKSHGGAADDDAAVVVGAQLGQRVAFFKKKK